MRMGLNGTPGYDEVLVAAMQTAGICVVSGRSTFTELAGREAWRRFSSNFSGKGSEVSSDVVLMKGLDER